MIRVFIGFDPREAVVFHACVQSLIRHSRRPLAITPLALGNLRSVYIEQHCDGSNAFAYSRFLTPYLCGFEGTAIYLDGDMIVRGDVAELLGLVGPEADVAVVKHDYETICKRKYLGAVNPDYPRKNWSSVIVWNCEAETHRRLTPEFVHRHDGPFLHRFSWMNDSRITELPKEWNWLVGEYDTNHKAKLLHYTLGSPCFPEYADCQHSRDWWDTFNSMILPIENVHEF